MMNFISCADVKTVIFSNHHFQGWKCLAYSEILKNDHY